MYIHTRETILFAAFPKGANCCSHPVLLQQVGYTFAPNAISFMNRIKYT